MDVVDIVLVVVLIAAAVHGLRLGALVQVFTFGGFLLGLTGGVVLASAVGGSIHSTTARTWVTLGLVIGLAAVTGAAGRMLGGWSYLAIRRHHLGSLDSALGVAVAVVAVLLSSWLVASVLADSRFSWFDSAVQRSQILRSMDNLLPPVPSVFARVSSFLNAEGFPAVFINLTGPDATNVAVPGQAAAQRLAQPALASTVKVLGQACGYQQEGSGFVVGRGMVATNAHVVAGETDTEVEVGGDAYRAVPVLYDPSFDLAVLRTDAPLGPPLSLDPDVVTRGTQGAILGYPENGPLTVGPAGVMTEVTAEGRDIYNEGLVTRDVYEVDAVVRPGNSGGPLIADDGEVVGVIFSRSTVYAGVGYALTSPAVLQRVDQAALHTAPVGTGACVQG